MSKTRDEVVDQAAKYNKLIGAGQSIEAEDQAAIDAHFEPLIEQLRAEEICDVTDPDEIPDEWFLAIAQLLANASGPEFGIEYSEARKITFENQLSRIVAGRPTYEVLKVDYF